jgi:hypothetical protein
MAVNLQYTEVMRELITQLLGELASIDVRLDLLEASSISSRVNAVDLLSDISDPHGVGDFVPKKTVSELGAVGNKYVLFGWSCVVEGNPGTFKECRFLTGN